MQNLYLSIADASAASCGGKERKHDDATELEYRASRRLFLDGRIASAVSRLGMEKNRRLYQQ